jgi:hypothetical protein
MNADDTTSTETAPKTSYLAYSGGRIAYDVAGGGPLIVLVPGMGDLRPAAPVSGHSCTTPPTAQSSRPPWPGSGGGRASRCSSPSA